MSVLTFQWVKNIKEKENTYIIYHINDKIKNVFIPVPHMI